LRARKPRRGDRRVAKLDDGVADLLGRLLLHVTTDVDDVVGDDAEADPAVHSNVALVAAAGEAVSPFDYADAALASGTPLLAVAERALFLLAFAFGALVERLGMQTRLTPFAFAAASFLAE
jgi:hypothetical protein